jgi:iron-sulfur cluster repair protein YtfE (RIC family)
MKRRETLFRVLNLLLPFLVTQPRTLLGEEHFPIPSSIKAEHEELQRELAIAVRSGGETGRAAKKVEELLSKHFVKEEAYALPPLSLLEPVSRGIITDGMAEVAKLSSKLEGEIPEMLREHAAIKDALKGLTEAASLERNMQATTFAERLLQHARSEEEILYPAAILVGKQAKALLKEQSPEAGP